MAHPTEQFVLRTGAPHQTAGGVVFTLEAGGHKHGDHGLTTGQWTLRFSRGQKKGALSFVVSGSEDRYGEGLAFDSLFQLLGEAPGGGVTVALRPDSTGGRPRDCREVLDAKSTFKLPEDISLAMGASAREGTGACIFSPLDDSAVVVVGKYSLEVLHAQRRTPRPGRLK